LGWRYLVWHYLVVYANLTIIYKPSSPSGLPLLGFVAAFGAGFGFLLTPAGDTGFIASAPVLKLMSVIAVTILELRALGLRS
jgi:hypothetical protein